MPYKASLIVLTILVGIGFSIWDRVRTPHLIDHSKVSEASAINQKIPDASFMSLDSQELSLHAFSGKVILLNFWATWCAPCIIEFPELLKLAQLKKDDVILIALSVDENQESVKPFLRKHGFETSASNVIIGHDAGKVVSQDLFQTILYPETFIIKPDLTLETKITGLIDWTGEDILYQIDQLINDDQDSDHE